MAYFQMRIHPYYRGSGGGLSVTDFHPRWKEVLPFSETFQRTMTEYTKKVSEWSGVPMGLEFSLEEGLLSVNVPTCGSLYLDRPPQEYRSHNIQSAIEVGAVAAVMTEYLYYMNFAIERLED